VIAVANIETRNQQATGFRLGLLGAGRLGDAIAKVWFARTGEVPLVWSRSGQYPSGDAEKRIDDGAWVANWTEALKAQSIVIAIPGRALLDFAEDSEQARTFEGNIFSAAASLSRDSLRRVFPMATIICIAPFLIDDSNSIPMLVLRPPRLPDLQWEKVKSELENFGDIDIVDDDDLFAHISLLGAPWPVVVLAAIQAAARIGVQGLQDETAIGIGQRLFFKAMQSLLSTQSINRLEQESSGDVVATPGGITERGLKNIEELTSLLECAFDTMQTRASELRA
jgi:pyrroline-5-carboxylate reductase